MTGAFVLGEVTAYWIGKMAEHGNGLRGILVFISIFILAAALYSAAGALSRIPMKDGREPFLTGGTCRILLLLWVCAAAGFFRMGQEGKPLPLEALLEQENSLPVQAEGRLTEEKSKNGMITLILSKVTLHLQEEGGGKLFLPRVMISLKEENWIPGEAVPGMKVRVSGRAELFEGPRNPGEFDYRLYSRSKKLRVKIRGRDAWVTDQNAPPFGRLIKAVRHKAESALEQFCEPEDRGIYQALLLGDQTLLSEEVRELYQESGIAHLLAVSGLHVSLIGMGLYGLLRRFGIGYGGAGALAGTVLLFYGGLTGFGPSVFRALAMILCTFLAAYLGRTCDLLSAAALSLFFLAFDSPYQLFAGGVQLSYGAVAAVGLGNEVSRGWSRKSQTLWISFCIQIVTYPILLYHFFEFPVYSIFLNLIVLPLMAYVVGSGLSAVFLGVLAQQAEHLMQMLSWGSGWGSGLSHVLGAAAVGALGSGHYLLKFYGFLCEAFLRLPFHSLTPGRPALLKILLYYLLLAVFFYQAKERIERGGLRGRAGSLGICFICILLLAVNPRFGFEAAVLDVGQGDGIFLEAGGTRLLVDCGSAQLKNVGKNRLIPFLKSRGITHLDYVFVTHGHLDHVNGIRHLLEEGRIPVELLVFSSLSREDQTCGELAALQEAAGGRVAYMEAGQSLMEGKLTIDCLYPSPSDQAGDKNDQSLVLLASYGDFRLLLTGDLEEYGENQLLEIHQDRLPPAITVLKAGHHGSKTSTTEELLTRLSPGAAILSYGEGNTYGHPSKEVVNRLNRHGVPVFKTAESGMISIWTDGKRMKIKGFISGKSGQPPPP